MTKPATKVTEVLTVATTRRGFLRRIARLAGGITAGVAGVLAGKPLHAGGRILCCRYITPQLIDYYVCRHNKCPEQLGSHNNYDWLLGYYEVSACSECG